MSCLDRTSVLENLHINGHVNSKGNGSQRSAKRGQGVFGNRSCNSTLITDVTQRTRDSLPHCARAQRDIRYKKSACPTTASLCNDKGTKRKNCTTFSTIHVAICKYRFGRKATQHRVVLLQRDTVVVHV